MKKHAHLIGLCGAGMRSLVDYLLGAGWSVSGSDESMRTDEQKELAEKGVIAFDFHAEENVPAETSLLIYSLAIPSENIERQSAGKRNIRCFSYVEYLGELFSGHRGVGIAGTHGKTTTTAILSHLLRKAGESPSVICGGKTQTRASRGDCGKSDLLVAECCEFRQSFLHYSTSMAVLLGVEADHFDCYPDVDLLVDAFSSFCERVDPTGLLVVNGDCELARRAARASSSQVIFYSVKNENEADWNVVSLSANRSGTHFDVRLPTGEEHKFEVPLFGVHQVANSLAAIIIAHQLGIEVKTIATGLQSFPGVERRFEIRGEYRGLICVDDYAHHPTEIAATILAARQRFGEVRLTIAFQPHQILRTKSLLDEFAAALQGADRVWVLPIYAAREKDEGQAETVAQELVRKGNLLQFEAEKENRPFGYSPSLDHLRLSLDDVLSTQDISTTDLFLTLGAGDIDRIYYDWHGFIPRNHTM